MNLSIHPDPARANAAASVLLCTFLTAPTARNVMVSAGNTPLELYRSVGRRGLRFSHLNVFALDEYVGVPIDEPRNCANLLRQQVAEAWKIPPAQFHVVSSIEEDALSSAEAHERLIAKSGGLDVIILGSDKMDISVSTNRAAPKTLGRASLTSSRIQSKPTVNGSTAITLRPAA
jgi:glucosamine-6-phosphate deaminase